MTLFVCLGGGGSLYGDEQCSEPGAAHALTRACVRVAGVPAHCTRNRSPLHGADAQVTACRQTPCVMQKAPRQCCAGAVGRANCSGRVEPVGYRTGGQLEASPAAILWARRASLPALRTAWGVPSKAPEHHMHLFLNAGQGNILAFFELPDCAPIGRDPSTPE